MRLVIVPRWSGTVDSDFYPWLRDRAAGAFDEIVGSALAPTPGAPEIGPCVANLRAAIGERGGETIVMGHSVGAQTVLRTLAAEDGPAVAGTLLVAGWLEVDEPWPSIRPWIDTPLHDDRIRARAGSLRVLLSTNDRFTADHASTRERFETRLHAQVQVVEGRDHFNASPQPEVLDALLRLLADVTA